MVSYLFFEVVSRLSDSKYSVKDICFNDISSTDSSKVTIPQTLIMSEVKLLLTLMI